MDVGASDSFYTSAIQLSITIQDVGQTIIREYPNIAMITGHCTGLYAKRLLAYKLRDNLMTFYSDAVFEL